MQQNAWDCANGPTVNLEIISSGTNMPQISISSGLQSDGIHYGAQPPQLTRPAPLTVMKDKNDRGKGPAYFFQQFYNKTVILREDEFVAGNYKRWSSRDIEAAESRAKRGRRSPVQHSIAQPSDRPWYCFWNDTILEGFIYATEANDDAVQTSAPLAPASTPLGMPGLGASATFSSPSGTNLAYNPSSATSGPWSKRQATPLPCPKIVKLEERRTYLSPTPYCQQMQILDSGQSVLADPPVNQTLDEDEPVQQNRLLDGGNSGQSRTTNGAFRKSVRGMNPTPGACQCQWLND